MKIHQVVPLAKVVTTMRQLVSDGCIRRGGYQWSVRKCNWSHGTRVVDLCGVIDHNE